MYAFKLKFNSNPHSDKGFEIALLPYIYIGSLVGGVIDIILCHRPITIRSLVCRLQDMLIFTLCLIYTKKKLYFRRST